MTDPIERLAEALVKHRDNHPDEDDRTIRVWIDEPGCDDNQMYHRFSEQQIAKLAEFITNGQPSSATSRRPDQITAAGRLGAFLRVIENVARLSPGVERLDCRVLIKGEPKSWAGTDITYADLRAVLDEREQLVARVAVLEAGLHDEFGILDHGGGMREARAEPLPMLEWNAALMVELRAEGMFDAGGRRPASLMRRKATDWAEVPRDVNPADIFAGYSSPRKAGA